MSSSISLVIVISLSRESDEEDEAADSDASAGERDDEFVYEVVGHIVSPWLVPLYYTTLHRVLHASLGHRVRFTQCVPAPYFSFNFSTQATAVS